MIRWLTEHPMQLVLLFGVGILAYSLWRIQRDPNVQFNLFDLLMENGRVSKIACTFMASFALSAWIMVKLTLDGKMSEGYIGIFGSMWVAPLIARVIFGKTNGATSTATTTTATTTTETVSTPKEKP